MEACGGAHFWARKLIELGHIARDPFLGGRGLSARLSLMGLVISMRASRGSPFQPAGSFGSLSIRFIYQPPMTELFINGVTMCQ
jgi:hypothetical protein